MQGELRLRVYSKIMDPFGEARPDCWITVRVTKRMGFDGFDWANPKEVFEEAAEPSLSDHKPHILLVYLLTR